MEQERMTNLVLYFKSNFKDKSRYNLVIYFESRKEFHVYDYHGIRTICVFRIKTIKGEGDKERIRNGQINWIV